MKNTRLFIKLALALALALTAIGFLQVAAPAYAMFDCGEDACCDSCYCYCQKPDKTVIQCGQYLQVDCDDPAAVAARCDSPW